jgi:hypothetical protein
MKLLQGEAGEKVLGVVWNHEQDAFMFKVHPPNEIKLTKRTILSHIARIYDHIGMAAAFLIRAKIEMQRLWLEGLDWDDELPPTSQVSWPNFFKEMNELNHVMFERSLTPDDVIGVPSLIIFADASREAFDTWCICQMGNYQSCVCYQICLGKIQSSPTETFDNSTTGITSCCFSRSIGSVYSSRITTSIRKHNILLGQ